MSTLTDAEILAAARVIANHDEYCGAIIVSVPCVPDGDCQCSRTAREALEAAARAHAAAVESPQKAKHLWSPPPGERILGMFRYQDVVVVGTTGGVYVIAEKGRGLAHGRRSRP